MRLLILCLLLIISTIVDSQIISGNYDSGLRLAYNPENKMITGFYENYSGYDETTGNPRFSCIFYLIGKYQSDSCAIETYFPLNKDDDKIIGKLKIKESNTISILLPEEHGGCWNVMHFADGDADFKLLESENWIEIRYIEADKSYFYNDKQDKSKRKSYLIKGDIVFIEKIEGDWIRCKYYGKSVTEGWMKKETVNK